MSLLLVPLVPVVASAVAGVAAFTDLRSRCIPNWLTLSAAGVGVALNGWSGGPQGGLTALAGLGLGLALLLPFYLMRAVGAGDVKLLAALGALLGPQALISVAVYGALVGGAMSAVVLIGRGRLLLTLSEMVVQRMLPSLSGATAPYGVAIAAGVYLSMVLPSVAG
jgi:prepilin peptidase CpaA